MLSQIQVFTESGFHTPPAGHTARTPPSQRPTCVEKGSNAPPCGTNDKVLPGQAGALRLAKEHFAQPKRRVAWRSPIVSLVPECNEPDQQALDHAHDETSTHEPPDVVVLAPCAAALRQTPPASAVPP